MFDYSYKKKIALIAHDNKKSDLLDWGKYNREILSKHTERFHHNGFSDFQSDQTGIYSCLFYDSAYIFYKFTLHCISAEEKCLP
ncbi:MAG: hypothetical protein A2Y21_06760 [Clostridiales bacterium GWC2_40_7]|nr:MAG: hypothetical protein A2Y21_06760 [Clostridiales bacterium GWC2_40_7]